MEKITKAIGGICMYCSKCGTQILEGGKFCPGCGQAVEPRTSAPENQTYGESRSYSQPGQSFDYREERSYSDQKVSKMNPLALSGFIVGCVSLFLNYLGIVGGTALGLSIAGLIQINNGKGTGKGFAIAGIALGAAGVLFGLLTLAGLSALY